MLFCEFGTASAKFPKQIFEKKTKKVLREIGENLVEFGGGVRCNLADFWRRFQGIIEGTFPASELFMKCILASEDHHRVKKLSQLIEK